jgi:hypothetical protein
MCFTARLSRRLVGLILARPKLTSETLVTQHGIEMPIQTGLCHASAGRRLPKLAILAF